MEPTFEDILNSDEFLFKAFGNLSSNKLKELSLRLQTFANHKEENERREEQRAALQAISDAIDGYVQDYGRFSLKITVPDGKGARERYGFEIDDVGDARGIGFNGLTIDCAGIGGRE